MLKRIKSIVKTIAIIIIVILVFTYPFLSWMIKGGKPRIKDFDEISHDYETIANLALEYYNKISSTDEHITLSLYDDYIEDKDNNKRIVLNDKQKDAVKCVKKRFGSFWVTEEAVIFWGDETKYYGLLYSKNPLSTIWDMKKDWYKGMEYHRINRKWYEIGAFGI